MRLPSFARPRTIAVGLSALVILMAGSVASHYAAMRPVAFPPSGAEEVHPGQQLAFRVDGGLPEGARISLRDEEGREIPVTAARGSDPRTMIATPEAPLDWAVAYRLCLSWSRWIREKQSCSQFSTMREQAPSGPDDAPILIAQGRDRPFAGYYRSILQAEGLNAFASTPLDALSDGNLAGRKVVLLDSATLPEDLTEPLTAWVREGGLLIAMQPSPRLATALGLPPVSGDPQELSLLLADATSDVSRGITRAPLQAHGSLALFDTEGAQTLLRPAGGPKGAATLVAQGQGFVAGFGFDLARSVVLSRQGNPLWIDEDRDGSEPLRSNDLFYPDFVDLAQAAVPAADELQRLLANLIVTRAPIPLPRIWYLPDARRAAVIMVGDDHATADGTVSLFRRLDSLSPQGCDLEGWECLRATSFLSPGTPLPPSQAAVFAARGFELGLHVDTGCESPKDGAALTETLNEQGAAFHDLYPFLPAQRTSRTHCIAWRGWVDMPRAEAAAGVQLDFNYYNWPPDWIAGKQVFLSGTGFPMPYSDLNGEIVDVYQAPSHLVNEDGVPHPEGILQLLDGALGEKQFFGAFGTHFDYTRGYARFLTEAARERGVALISAEQMLRWLEGRNGSAFTGLRWEGSLLHFTPEIAPGAERASLMLPVAWRGQRLMAVHCGNSELTLSRQEIKGLDLAFFSSPKGACTARYEGGA